MSKSDSQSMRCELAKAHSLLEDYQTCEDIQRILADAQKENNLITDVTITLTIANPKTESRNKRSFRIQDLQNLKTIGEAFSMIDKDRRKNDE